MNAPTYTSAFECTLPGRAPQYRIEFFADRSYKCYRRGKRGNLLPLPAAATKLRAELLYGDKTFI